MLPNNSNFDLTAAPCLPAVLAQMLDACVREDETFAHAAQLALLDPALYAQLVEAASALGDDKRRFAVVSKLLAGLGWYYSHSCLQRRAPAVRATRRGSSSSLVAQGGTWRSFLPADRAQDSLSKSTEGMAGC
jgi:hypothetical protein